MVLVKTLVPLEITQMINEIQGNLLDSDCFALVNTVNCVGIMGKGLAKEFRNRYPEMLFEYKMSCGNGRLHPGGIFHWALAGEPEKPRHWKNGVTGWIFNIATKDHWKDLSKIEWIKEGLSNLQLHVKGLEIPSIAVPPLGCGNGGLDWDEVKPLILDTFKDIDMRVDLYVP